MAMQEILFILKTGHVPESKLISVEESIARARAMDSSTEMSLLSGT